MDKLNLDDVNERDIEGFEKVYNTKEWEDTLTEGIQKFAVPALKKVQEETAKAKDAEFAEKLSKILQVIKDFRNRKLWDNKLERMFNALIIDIEDKFKEIFPNTDSDISLCKKCNCMTKSIPTNVEHIFTCGKCGFTKYTKRKETMHERYGDGSDHKCCDKCGFCLDCGDCKRYGCGEQAKEKKC